MTSAHVVYMWVKKISGAAALADLPAIVDPSDVGTPMYFISHAWKGRFTKLVQTIEGFLTNASDDTCIW